MGVDFSPDLPDDSHATWSYGGFDEFRNRLREHDLAKQGIIDKFLLHSDCDGVLLPAQCAELIPHLRQIITSWPDVKQEVDVRLFYDKSMGLKLLEQMEFCIETEQVLEFS